jgi:hypothetical protein
VPSINFDIVNVPIFTKPEILVGGTIPRPLSGVAPRKYMPLERWDGIRKEAYQANNYCCWACGCHNDKPLEAHERYDVDYQTGTMFYKETVALCNDCHAFVHIGRLTTLAIRHGISKKDFKRIVKRGCKLLDRAALAYPWSIGNIKMAEYLFINDRGWVTKILHKTPKPPECDVPWPDWRMIFEGKKYGPRFHSTAEVDSYYNSLEEK